MEFCVLMQNVVLVMFLSFIAENSNIIIIIQLIICTWCIQVIYEFF